MVLLPCLHGGISTCNLCIICCFKLTAKIFLTWIVKWLVLDFQLVLLVCLGSGFLLLPFDWFHLGVLQFLLSLYIVAISFVFSVPYFNSSGLILPSPALLFCSYLIAACTSSLVNGVFIGVGGIPGNGDRSLNCF